MKLKKLIAVLSAAAVAVSGMAVSAFALDSVTGAYLLNPEEATVNEYPDSYADKDSIKEKLGKVEAAVVNSEILIKFTEKTKENLADIVDSTGKNNVVYLNVLINAEVEFNTTYFKFSSGYDWDDKNHKEWNVSGRNIMLWLRPTAENDTVVITYETDVSPMVRPLTIHFEYKTDESETSNQTPSGSEEETTTPPAQESTTTTLPANVPNIRPVAPITAAVSEVVTAANGESVEAPKDVVPAGAALEVEEQTKEEAVKAVETIKTADENREVVETVKKAVEDAKAAVMDINLIKDGVKIQPNGAIKVTINVPETLKNAAKLFVYRVEANGTFTDVKATVEGGKLVFSTSHFSTYIITSEALSGDAVVTEAATTSAAAETTAAATAGSNGTTDKNQATGVMIAVVPAAMAMAGVILSKKRK